MVNHWQPRPSLGDATMHVWSQPGRVEGGGQQFPVQRQGGQRWYHFPANNKDVNLGHYSTRFTYYKSNITYFKSRVSVITIPPDNY